MYSLQITVPTTLLDKFNHWSKFVLLPSIASDIPTSSWICFLSWWMPIFPISPWSLTRPLRRCVCWYRTRTNSSTGGGSFISPDHMDLKWLRWYISSYVLNAPHHVFLQVQDKFRLDLSDEEAVHYMQSLIDESVGALFAAVVEQIHKFAQVCKLRLKCVPLHHRCTFNTWSLNLNHFVLTSKFAIHCFCVFWICSGFFFIIHVLSN